MKDYLTDAEVLKIEVFCKDTVMYEAVKKVILQSVYSNGVMKEGQPHNPLHNRALALVEGATDGEIGSRVRAWYEGVNALEGGYKELRTITSKKADTKADKDNIAE